MRFSLDLEHVAESGDVEVELAEQHVEHGLAQLTDLAQAREPERGVIGAIAVLAAGLKQLLGLAGASLGAVHGLDGGANLSPLALVEDAGDHLPEVGLAAVADAAVAA